jgi:UDP-glucose 4-epimerase
MDSILITGGLGYIGSHVCVELIKKGFNVIIVDNLSNSDLSVLDRIEKLTGLKPLLYDDDINDKFKLKNIFNNHSINSVMHFAGLKSVGESIEKPLSYYGNNLCGTINLLEIMKGANCKSIVFSSSATVYGKAEDNPIKESSTLSASNPYGQTKLFIERLLEGLYEADNEWKIAILRYFNPAGAHESGLLGEAPHGRPNNLFPYIAGVASGRFAKLIIFGNDYETHDGTGIRDYIHVVDLAKGHIKALEALKYKTKFLVINLGTGVGYSVLDVLKEFERASKKKIPFEYSERRAGDVSKCYADVSLSFKLLSWKAEHNLSKMCIDAWKWESSRS